MISRDINWVPSIDEHNDQPLRDLEDRLTEFYARNADYYGAIDFTADNWINDQEHGYQEILKSLQDKNKICEVGCGNANLLKHFPEIMPRYTGCDFSETLMKRNQAQYPQANFAQINKADALPFQDEMFDVVFSVFVLEHSTRPARFIQECLRVLKEGGTLIILCPDFLGKGRMTSQRAGWTHGTASQKLKRSRYLDAVMTLYDNRIRIPNYCEKLLRRVNNNPQFFVNLSPIVFEDPFMPDVDAVYVTCKEEIECFLRPFLQLEVNQDNIVKYESDRSLIFVKGTKFHSR